MYQIIEQFTTSKTGHARDNEDALFFNEGYVAVIDGATSKSDVRFHNCTSGQLSTSIICSALRTLKGHESHNDVLAHLQNALICEGQKHHFADNCIHLSASCIIYSVCHQALWGIGDCQYLINNTVHKNNKEIDRIMSDARKMIIHCLLQKGFTEKMLMEHDESRRLIMPLLKLQEHLENTEDELGYSCLNAQTRRKSSDFSFSVPVCPGTEIILATDGYPFLKKTLEESEAALSALLNDDPLCYREYCSTKGVSNGNVSFDDRTYIRFVAG